jgi:Tfp pilus assembly protein PilO
MPLLLLLLLLLMMMIVVVTAAWLALRLGVQTPRGQQEEDQSQLKSHYQELLDSLSQQQ